MRRRALIIGISEYDRLARFSFCQNDADGMYEVLRWAGYDIPNYNKLTGYVDWESMRNTTIDFFVDHSITNDDILILYYSGHSIQREDRIMGAISYGKTLRLRQRDAHSKDKAVCLEIHKSFDTPENILLASVLISVVAYCDKYLVRNGELESGIKIDEHIVSSLKLIQQYTTGLLVTRPIKQIIPYTENSLSSYHDLFKLTMDRVYLGKIPKYFANILKLFYEWRYFRWVTAKNSSLFKHMLRYHFFNIRNPHFLFECWVFYKILDIMVDKFGVKFKGSKKSETTFASDDGSVQVVYQRRYKSKWLRNGKALNEVPDIVIEFRAGSKLAVVIVDAKNAEYDSDIHSPYRRQIDDYMGYADAPIGVLIFSRGKEGLWDDLTTNEENILSLTTLIPSLTGINDSTNNTNLEKFIQLVESRGYRKKP